MESLSYTTLVCHYPKQISKLSPSGQEPELIFKFVHLFKLVQVVAFSLWYLPRFGLDLPPTLPGLPALAFATYLLVFGQVLNACVWHQIGIEGVCYGIKFGRKIPWFSSLTHRVDYHSHH
ncbi:hypothetical protein BASA81_012636 [Batrachochytrium salamandrivorans]|nr:hypothetical protein BASA81_012636 [Batrachochytrium salamandrivorans]